MIAILWKEPTPWAYGCGFTGKDRQAAGPCVPSWEVQKTSKRPVL